VGKFRCGYYTCAMRPRSIPLGLALLLWMNASAGADTIPGSACDKLVSMTIPNVEVRSATVVAAGQFLPPGSTQALTVPEFCRVQAIARPVADSEIHFEVWIPPQADWNGKFLGVGNGGYSGDLSYGWMAAALRHGYATGSHDTGHSGNDMQFGQGHPEKIVDYSYRAVHVMSENSKLLIRVQTGRFAERSYFAGCSAGGHQALSEAQRYPADYDGIIAGAPVNNRIRFTFGTTWYWMAAHPNGTLVLPPARLPLITKAIVAACDAIDGVKDGIIDDPRACPFDVATLQCKGADNDNCLTASQVEAVRKIHDGLKDPQTGEQIFPGLPKGSEDTGEQSWREYVLDPPEPKRVNFFRYFLFDDPNWDWRTIQWSRDLAYAEEKLAYMDATDPNLTPFERHGGKLIMTAGWSDPLIAPEDTVAYYQAVTKASGGPERTLRFARLFMAPGMAHCGDGPGPHPASFDTVSALDDWVTKQRAPDRLIASSRADDGQVSRTRPLCPYPQVARYQGKGNVDSAANFACVKPAASSNGRPTTRSLDP
jgi:tannase/feruloyl esterase